MKNFHLDARLEGDTIALGESPLCLYRLMDDARWPWVILVPKRGGVTEIHDLDDADHDTLCRESRTVARAMAEAFAADAMNVAKLGNVVAQLHLHHVVRHRNDPAWPGPVWGVGQRVPYDDRERAEIAARLSRCLDFWVVNGQ
jgi:diadenosine tetraphosphate (Ap4A) HIT family hydrolase